MDPRLFVLICLAAASRHQPSSVLEVEAHDPQGHAFNETDFQRLRDAVNSGDEYRMEDIAEAEMWPSFVKAHPEEGLGLFEKLATDKKHGNVRMGAADSPAWPMLLQTNFAEAWRLFEQLAKDDWTVRWGAANSPAWPDLIQSSLPRSLQLFAELMSDQESRVPKIKDLVRLGFGDFGSLASWKDLGKVLPTAVAERDSQELQDIARSLQKLADNGHSHRVKGLRLINGFSTALRRSMNETWLGEMVKLPLFAGNAAERVSPAENIYLDCLSEFFRKRIA